MTTVPTPIPPPHFIEARDFYRGFQCGVLWIAMSVLPPGQMVQQMVYEDVLGWCRLMAERLNLEFEATHGPNGLVLVQASKPPARARAKR
jgi:hypothetical protein